MKNERLPVSCDPERFAQSGRELSALMPLKNLPRLQDVLAEPTGEVAVEMHFGFDEERRLVIDLSLKAEVPLTCQRTLELFFYPIDAKIHLCPIEDEAEAKQLPSHCEPVLLQNGLVRPQDLVEDEILLNLPIVPMKPEKDCSSEANQAYYADSKDPREKTGSKNPFSVLADLKKDLD